VPSLHPPPVLSKQALLAMHKKEKYEQVTNIKAKK
jgi:hypothetical protein